LEGYGVLCKLTPFESRLFFTVQFTTECTVHCTSDRAASLTTYSLIYNNIYIYIFDLRVLYCDSDRTASLKVLFREPAILHFNSPLLVVSSPCIYIYQTLYMQDFSSIQFRVRHTPILFHARVSSVLYCTSDRAANLKVLFLQPHATTSYKPYTRSIAASLDCAISY
jgi:hypothetical protein